MKAKKDPGDCIFCLAAENPDQDREHLVVHRGERCFVILNRYPYTSGHLMIVPYDHVSKLNLTTLETSTEMMTLSRLSEQLLENVYQADGLNLGLNVGSAAGAGIAQHLHLHMLPRWSGDANFMTTVAHARVIPESLDETYRKVHEGFQKLLTS
ncbi:MAG TPA: HIT domain-containing protein [Bryobacteraceae bacterium]|nr:HIT domain-containing protein [Bryobacteraceae bacterium]